MAQTNKQSITFPKTYAIIMITQFNIKDGLKAYSNKGDEAILKEVKNYIHNKHLCHEADMKCHMIRERKF